MGINLTKARPYAKAIFALALKQNKLPVWEELLTSLANLATICNNRRLLGNYKLAYEQKMELFNKLVTSQVPQAVNLLHILAKQRHLYLLPAIAANYQQRCYHHNKILVATVVTAYTLSAEHKTRLVQALTQRYHHTIVLREEVAPQLIGGAIIYIAGKTIDGSIKGKLCHLTQHLLFKERA